MPEILVPALEQLEAAFLDAQEDAGFQAELAELLANYAGRPTPLTRCRNLGAGKARIYLKREDLLHGGAHKTNQVLGQALLARRMGKTRLIAETGAGQHGVATAMAGALFGLETRIYMGARRRRAAAAQRLPDAADGRRGGAGRERRPGPQGRDQRGAARLDGELRRHPLSARHRRRAASLPDHGARIPAGDRPRGARADPRARRAGCPTRSIACVGGGSNAIGLFADFIDDEDVRLIGVEAAGKGLDGGEHGATLLRGRPGILHGAETYVLQDADGQISRQLVGLGRARLSGGRARSMPS